MKLKDLISKLATLNPEAEVYLCGGEGRYAYHVGSIATGVEYRSGPYRHVEMSAADATPSDTLIVLSE